VLLAQQGGRSSAILFGSAGIAYLVSGFIFKIPMPIQPLKSIAVGAVALGASGNEIRLSGAILGVACLLMTLAKLHRFVDRVPISLVHSVQAGLGMILVIQGLREGGTLYAHNAWGSLAISILLCLGLLFARKGPWLGLVAGFGLVLDLFFPTHLAPVALGNEVASSSIRFLMILSLVLPQLALTLTNSVVATVRTARLYYGERAARVTGQNLLLSIGFGNIISAVVGGLPYCHGSGGLTAHYKGGARTWLSNVIIGIFLMGLAAFSYFSGRTVLLNYPPYIHLSLLVVIGIFHIYLAEGTWRTPLGRLSLMAAALAAALTQNMLIVLLVGSIAEVGKTRFFQKEA
jgi:SulP family sulfate permease